MLAQASLIGKRYGRQRWPDSNKTVEGTLGFVAAVLASSMAIVYVTSLIGKEASLPLVTFSGRNAWMSYAMITLATGMP